MDAIYLLQRVLPSADYGTYVANTQYTKAGTTDKVVFNTSFDTIESLQEFSERSSRQGSTAYFALGTFANNMVLDEKTGKIRCKRKASMAQAFKTLAIDIDCGDNKPYLTQREGLVALRQFMADSGMPLPIIVSSGHGLHAYWALTEAIDCATWTRTSTSLRELTILKGLKIDESKVCDPAMVLRPLGTTNWKGEGIPVKLLVDSIDYTPASLMAAIGTVKAPRPLPAGTFAQTDALMDSTAGMGELEPADIEPIIRRCQQMQLLTFGRGINCSEPQWRAVVGGIDNYCKDGVEHAMHHSSGHPDFTPSKTIEKMENWKNGCTGAASCAHFESVNPSGCRDCVYIDKIKSPISLGYAAPESLPSLLDMPDLPDTEAIALAITTRTPSIPAPDRFIRSTAGVYKVVEDGVAAMLCAYDMFPVLIIYDSALGYEEAVWLWNKPHCGYIEMRVRLAHIFNEGTNDLITTLSNNGCMVATKVNQNGIAMYMRAYMQSLQQAQAHKELYKTMGWKPDGSFILGTTEIKDTPTGLAATEVGISKTLLDRGMDKAFTCKGDPALWTKWTKIFNHKELKLHGFTLGAAFAAPLIRFTALHGYCLSLVGESGSGKSTMQRMINSVYGNPQRLEMKKSDTQMAIVSRMEQVAHLPVTIDECTQIDPLLLVDFVYWGSQGCDKHRFTDTGEKGFWALPVVLSSNKSLRDKLIIAQPDDTAASMRLMEFAFPHNSVFDGSQDFGRQLAYMVQDNHGYIGRTYLAYLVELGDAEISRRWDKAITSFEARYDCKFGGAERYWELCMVVQDFGLELAAEAGLIDYDYKVCTQAALDQLRLQRTIVHDSQLNPYDMVASFVNSNLHAAVNVTYNFEGKGTANLDQPLRECFIRRELYKDKAGVVRHGYLYFDRSIFRKWLHTNKWDYKKIFDTLYSEGALYSPNKSDKISMGKDTPMRLGQVPVLGLRLSHAMLTHMLRDGIEDGVPTNNVVAFAKEK